jgi:hypothetical protein
LKPSGIICLFMQPFVLTNLFPHAKNIPQFNVARPVAAVHPQRFTAPLVPLVPPLA